MNLRKQYEDDDKGFMAMVDEHMASISDDFDYESDQTDQVLVVDEHIVPMADPYWGGDYEFSNSYDDADSLWLCALAGIVSAIDETELPSPVTKPIALPRDDVRQWGNASICWYSALRACWTEAKLLLAQEELARGPGSAPVGQINASWIHWHQ